MVEKSNIDMLNRKIYNYLRNFFKMDKKEGVSYSMTHPLSFIYTCLVGKTI